MKYIDTDEGLEFVKLLGFRPTRNRGGFRSAIIRELGRDFFERMCDVFEARVDDNRKNNNDIYALKNQSYNISMTFSGLYESDYYRKAINFYSSQADHIKGNILDIGCDNGILTCYLARKFPNSKVVGVERIGYSLAIARELAEKLGLSNVSFIETELSEFNPEEKFETITSSRTLSENSTGVIEPSLYGFTKTLREVSAEYRDSLIGHVEVISSLLKDGGYVVQCERLHDNQMHIGYLQAMNRGKFTQIGETEFFEANEGGNEDSFAGMVFKKEAPSDTEEEIFLRWRKSIVDNASLYSGKYYFGLEAQAYIESIDFHQDYGYTLSDPKIGEYHNMSYAIGYTDDPERKLIKYNITDYDEYNEEDKRQQVLEFVDENIYKLMLAEQEGTVKEAKRREWTVEEHYFGDKK